MKQIVANILYDIRQAWRTDRRMYYGAHLLGLLLTGSIIWPLLVTLLLIFHPMAAALYEAPGYIFLTFLFLFMFYGWWWYVTQFMLLSRHYDHIERKSRLFFGLAEYTKLCAAEKSESLDQEWNKKIYSLHLFAMEYRKLFVLRHPGLWSFLSFITFNVISFFIAANLQREQQRMQQFEEEFLELLSECWLKLKILDHPIQYDRTIPPREYAVHLALSIVSFGLYWYYWWYLLIADGNRLFAASERWENSIVSAFCFTDHK